MATLLIQLVAPMQSWGLKSAFEQRNTQPEPTKSGVLGLLCAALGRERVEPIDDLVQLKMGVRVDDPGLLNFDFQTALTVGKADGSKPDTQLSKRAYLSDAAFWVGLEGEKPLLEKLHHVLLNPKWPLFLGRKSYLPSLPLTHPDSNFAIFDLSLEEALRVADKSQINKNQKLVKLVMESELSDMVEERFDVPVSFEIDKRSFTSRFVKTSWEPIESFQEG